MFIKKAQESFFWILNGILLGCLIGPLCFLLSMLVGSASAIRGNSHWLIFFIPLASLAITWLYQKSGKVLNNPQARSIDLINETIMSKTNPANTTFDPSWNKDEEGIPPRLAPMLLITTFLTHLVGASFGKEGAGVQMGTSVASYIQKLEGKLIKTGSGDRHLEIWLITGAGAAFGSLFQAPVAGTLFGLMMASPKVTRMEALLPCLTANICGVTLTKLLGGHTLAISGILMLPSSLKTMAIAVAIGIISGLGARLFIYIAHGTRKLVEKASDNVFKRVLIASSLILAISIILEYGFGISNVNGLSADLLENGSVELGLLKIILTALTISAGFTGGEVVPLLVIGSCLLRPMAPVFDIPAANMAMLGAIGALSAATNLPIVCFALGLELFGLSNIPMLFITSSVAFLCSGSSGIYPHQQ